MLNLVLVFDLDDTLYPERQFALSGFAAAELWAQTSLGLTGLAADMTRLLDQGHLGQLFRLVLEARMPEHRPEHLAGLLQAYRSHVPSLMLFEDAAWALSHFGGQLRLGLITDGTHSVQRRKVEALGVARRFREIVYTDALGGRAFAKPHQQSFQMMEAALGGDADRFVYVGDNPAKDFVAPNARGWVTVMVDRPGALKIHAGAKPAEGGRPQHTIASLRELTAVLKL
ncbi:MAG TPA: HAD family hydrolase [Hyphomicrobiaceae bacterium]|jgi:putative hydrolase of the HAD superfamily|nr:HAD family hydrolase [Hyphomicrobiaceae bacterium]